MSLNFTDDRGTRHLFTSIAARDEFLDRHPHLRKYAAKRVAADGEVIRVPMTVMDAAPWAQAAFAADSGKRDEHAAAQAASDAAFDHSVAAINSWRDGRAPVAQSVVADAAAEADAYQRSVARVNEGRSK